MVLCVAGGEGEEVDEIVEVTVVSETGAEMTGAEVTPAAAVDAGDVSTAAGLRESVQAPISITAPIRATQTVSSSL